MIQRNKYNSNFSLFSQEKEGENKKERTVQKVADCVLSNSLYNFDLYLVRKLLIYVYQQGAIFLTFIKKNICELERSFLFILLYITTLNYQN